MTRDEFDQFCGTLKATDNVVQWGNSSVWKVGGRIFAVCSIWGDGEEQKISFKCSDLAYEVLCEKDGIVPAPYLAKAKWVQLATPEAMNDEDIRLHITDAYDIIRGKLTKAQRNELGL
ncbi:MmcQ/YjbR family DNA-binding protein [Emcibacter sp.]|uniref:MmcQ/YjbR family DNA-binding protein n=1 Tax=Emcibacter sp. TaxID=1979954 RepID=UPI002AA8F2A0|nr:MmcQ/YjbR family DNA-binding protein [Emcibacter sp.]